LNQVVRLQKSNVQQRFVFIEGVVDSGSLY